MTDRISVLIKRIHPEAEIGIGPPQRATSGSVGWDLRSTCDVQCVPHTLTMIGTGFAWQIPEGFEGQVRLRSGLARHGLVQPNAPGTIDSDYRGEVKVAIWNMTGCVYDILRGDRIAQLVIAPVPQVELVLVDELEETERGAGGFGSTGR